MKSRSWCINSNCWYIHTTISDDHSQFPNIRFVFSIRRSIVASSRNHNYLQTKVYENYFQASDQAQPDCQTRYLAMMQNSQPRPLHQKCEKYNFYFSRLFFFFVFVYLRLPLRSIKNVKLYTHVSQTTVKTTPAAVAATTTTSRMKTQKDKKKKQ